MTTQTEIIDRTLLRVGDVFKHQDGKLVVVYKVMEAWATVQPLVRKSREIVVRDLANGNDAKKVKFTVPEKSFNISAHSEVDLIARLGDDWKRKNLANEIPEITGETIHVGSEKQKDKTMKIKRSVAVALMVAFDFPKAGDWSTDKLTERLAQVPEKVDAADVPSEFKDVYQALCDSKGKATLIDDGDAKDADDETEVKEEKVSKKEKKSKAAAKPAKVVKPEKVKEKPAKKEKEKATNGEVSLSGRSDYVKALVKAGKLKPEEIFLKTKEKYPTSSRFNVNKIIASSKKKLAKASKE